MSDEGRHHRGARSVIRMFITTRWKMALRCIASALVFESALSFRPVFQHQHQHDVPAERGLFSSPLKSSGSYAHQTSGLLRPSRLQVERSGPRHRQRGTPPEQQSLLVVMLAGEGGDGAGGGVTRVGESAVGAVPHAAGNAPTPRAEQQVTCLKIGSTHRVEPYGLCT